MRKLGKIGAIITFSVLLGAINFIMTINDKSDADSTLRLYAGFAEPIELADPRRVQYRTEFNFLRMLYSPLISFEPTGALSSGLAEDFYWKGDEAHFHLRPNARTSKGQPITVDDIAATFARLGSTQGGTHGNLFDLMCDTETSHEKCIKISKVSDLHFYIKFPRQSEFLFKLLSSMDYVIIPKIAVDPITGEIIDHSNTTGPYWIEARTAENKSALKANKLHWQWNQKMPDVVEIIYNNPNKDKITPLEKVFENLLSNEISLIPTYAFVPHHKLAEFIDSHREKINIHQTEQISIEHLRTTKNAKEFDSATLRYILNRVKAEYTKNLLKTNFASRSRIEFVAATDQFFHPRSIGGLEQAQIEILNSMPTNLPTMTNTRKLRIGCSQNLKARYEERLGDSLRFVEVIELTSVAARSEVDAYFAETDSSFFEDVSQIYFIANTGLLPLNKTETDSFVKRYVNEWNIENRIRLIREMHLQMLKEMTVIPLVIKPYFAVTNKNWQMTLPTLQAGTPIWGITKSN
jgi:hypothetical protein